MFQPALVVAPSQDPPLTPLLSCPFAFHSAAELTFYLPRNTMPMTTSFATEAHFERFAGRELHHMDEGGTTLGVILTTEQARTAMAVPKTRFVLQTAFSELVENVMPPTASM